MRVGAGPAAAEVAEEADADVEDREALEETVAAYEVRGDQQIVAVAVGEDLLYFADTHAVPVDDSAAEEQLQLRLIL
jgi:hypothetical protein